VILHGVMAVCATAVPEPSPIPPDSGLVPRGTTASLGQDRPTCPPGAELASPPGRSGRGAETRRAVGGSCGRTCARGSLARRLLDPWIRPDRSRRTAEAARRHDRPAMASHSTIRPGGQMSKATPRGAVAKFATGGKPGAKKAEHLAALPVRTPAAP